MIKREREKMDKKYIKQEKEGKNAAQYNTVQYSTVQYNIVQYSIVQYSIV